MGLDTSHDCWHGGYVLFSFWRERLTEAAGLPPLSLMENFWQHPLSEASFSLYGDQLTLKVAAQTLEYKGDTTGADSLRRILNRRAIRWDALKPRPLLGLLNHSDCDGIIPAADCAPLADDLEGLIPSLPDAEGNWPKDEWRKRTARFVAGLRKAAAAGEDVEFR